MVVHNPALSVLADKQRFQNIAEKLQSNCCEDLGGRVILEQEKTVVKKRLTLFVLLIKAGNKHS